MDVGTLIVLVAATVGFQGQEIDFDALPRFDPSKEWAAAVANSTGRGKATEIEIEAIQRLFEATNFRHPLQPFPDAAKIASDKEWQRLCDGIAGEVLGRKATIQDLFQFQALSHQCGNAELFVLRLRDLNSTRPFSAKGTVLDENRKPVAGARVRSNWQETTTDADGKFSLEARSKSGDQYVFFIEAEGMETARLTFAESSSNSAIPNRSHIVSRSSAVPIERKSASDTGVSLALSANSNRCW